MRRTIVPLFLLLTATTFRGLAAGLGRLESCGSGSTSLIDHVLCDPDHLVSPYDSHNIIQLLTECGDKSGHTKMVVFLAANFNPHDNVKPTTATATTITTTGAFKDSGGGGRGGDGDRSRNINRLRELVVASNNLTTTTFSVILLVAIRDPFQITTWRSDSLYNVLTNTTMEEARQKAGTPLDHQNFTSAVMHVANYLCQSARPSSSRTLKDIILTVVWIAFTAAFVSLLMTIAVVLLRVRHRALTKARAEAIQQRAKKTGSQHYPTARASDIQDFSVVYFKTTGHVLLGTTDIIAIPAQDCSSTDNLLLD